MHVRRPHMRGLRILDVTVPHLPSCPLPPTDSPSEGPASDITASNMSDWLQRIRQKTERLKGAAAAEAETCSPPPRGASVRSPA